jgi:branched-chain amino acid transport system permease protein
MSRANSARSERPWIPLAVAAGAIAVGVGFAFGMPAYVVFVSTSVLVSMVSLLGLGIVTGTAGMIALCQLSFAAIGAWILEFLYLDTPLPAVLGPMAFIVFMLIAGLVTALLGLIVGLPALRLRGVNLAVITLGVAAALDATLQKISFPDHGVAHIPRPFGLGYDPQGDRAYFIFAVVVTVVVALIILAIQRSRTGGSWKSVAFSERGTASAGTSVRTAKLSAFALSAFVGGIAGCLIVGQITQVNYLTFTPINSLGLYVLSIVVGSHLIDMALFGGILFVLIPEILKQLRVPLEWSSIAFGILGIQALTTNSNLGSTIRAAIFRRRRQAEQQRAAESDVTSTLTTKTNEAPIPAGTGRPLLVVENLTVEFGAVKALTNVSMTVEEGTILGLIGPNGAGKSTFVDAIGGFLPQHRGTATLDGQPLDGLPPHQRARAGLRRTFQQDRVPPTMTVGAYVRFVTRGTADAPAIDDALAFFGCPEASTPLSVVDVGTRRLVEVAANLAARPKLLLLDEPAAGLSHDEHIAFGDRLRRAPGHFGSTILIIEHDLDLVRSVCSTITVLNFGEVLATGDRTTVLSNPKVIAAYMGETEML